MSADEMNRLTLLNGDMGRCSDYEGLLFAYQSWLTVPGDTTINRDFLSSIEAVEIIGLLMRAQAENPERAEELRAQIEAVLITHDRQYAQAESDSVWFEITGEILENEYNASITRLILQTAQQQPAFRSMSEAELTAIMQPVIDYYRDPSEASYDAMVERVAELQVADTDASRRGTQQLSDCFTGTIGAAGLVVAVLCGRVENESAIRADQMRRINSGNK